jgi:uncharacterized protein (TIGR03435 family)
MGLRSLALAVLVCFALRSQNTPLHVTFDAASIKVVPRSQLPGPEDMMKRGGPGTGDPGRIIWNRTTLRQLLAAAWGVDQERIVGPASLNGPFQGGEWYALTATMPSDTSREAFQLMLQNLVVERFAAKLHHETRVFPGYELVVAKGGPKLKPAAVPNAPPAVYGRESQYGPDGFAVMPAGHGYRAAIRPGGVFLTYQGFSMSEFIRSQFSEWVRQVSGHTWDYIEDKTGLEGEFDFTLKFVLGDLAAAANAGPQAHAAMSSASAEGPANEPSASDGLFKAVEKQLGLQLVRSAKGFALDTIVIDHIENMPIE